MEILNDYTIKILNGIADGIYITDCNRIITFWNKAAESITGYSKVEVLGKSCADNILNHIDSSGKNLCTSHCPLAEAIKDGSDQEADVFLHHKKGHRIPVKIRAFPIKNPQGDMVGIVETFNDTSEILNANKKIDFLTEEVLFDPLLKIGNRRFSDMEFQARDQEKKRYGWGYAAALCDIDDFKNINDCFGHEVGDEILKMVANTMSETLRSVDFLGRWGGEEFLILLPNINSENETIQILERIRNLIRESFIFKGGQKISVTASFGASIAKDTDTPKTLFSRIDKLLYLSKKSGKNKVTLK